MIPPRLAALATLCLASLCAPSIAATSAVTVQLGCAASFGTSHASCPYPLSQQSTNPAPTTRVQTQYEVMDPVSGAVNSSGGSAYATYGAIGAMAWANASSASVNGATSPHTSAGSNAQAVATFGDTFFVNAPNLTGQSGRLLITLNLDGDLSAWDHSVNIGSATNEGFKASAEADLTVWDSSVGGQLATTRWIDEAAVNGPGDSVSTRLPALVTLSVPFVFGHAMYFESSLTLKAEAIANAPHLSPGDPLYAFPRSGGSDASFMHTLAWGGITGIVDAGGQAVAGSTLTSTTGIDWLVAYPIAAVPEPAAAALWLLGLVALVARRRAAVAAHA